MVHANLEGASLMSMSVSMSCMEWAAPTSALTVPCAHGLARKGRGFLLGGAG